MERKKISRNLITVILLGALIAVVFISQKYDPNNPHSTIPEETWIHGPNGHGYAVWNNQNPEKNCYRCHVDQGLGGETYCQSCHDQSNVNVVIPSQQSK